MAKTVRFTDFLHYRIEKELGGHMSKVYLAFDTQVQRSVVLKLIPNIPDQELDIEAERNGAEAQKRLWARDLRVPEIYACRIEGEYFYVAMEHVEGEDLSQKIRRGPIPPDRAARYSIEILQLIEKAQGIHIIHGDIKPGNIRITSEEKVRVLDFGIAKAVSTQRNSTKNPFRSTEYASPERIDDGNMSVESDLWSVGVTLYEMVSGQRPFKVSLNQRQQRDSRAIDAAIEREITAYARNGNPKQLTQSLSHCPESLRLIIEKALAPQLVYRYITPAEFREDLERFQRGEKTLAEMEAESIADAPTRRTNKLPNAEQDPATKRTATRPLETPSPYSIPSSETTRSARVEPPPILSSPLPAPPNPGTPPLAKPAAPLSTKSKGHGRWAVLGVAGLVLIYLLANEYSVWSGIRQIEPELTGAASPEEIGRKYELYQALAKRSYLFGLGLKPGNASLREQLVKRANAEIDRYRNPQTADTVKKTNWLQAELCLRWATDLSKDSEIEARLPYCEGHILRISGTPYEAIRKFEKAAELKPDWVDPHLGLARIYTYDSRAKNSDKAESEIRKLEGLGYQETTLTALDADNCLARSNDDYRVARALRNPVEEKEMLNKARQSCERAQELYGKIPNFGNSRRNKDAARQRCDQINQRLGEME